MIRRVTTHREAVMGRAPDEARFVVTINRRKAVHAMYWKANGRHHFRLNSHNAPISRSYTGVAHSARAACYICESHVEKLIMLEERAEEMTINIRKAP